MEGIFVIEGEVEVELDGETRRLTAGQGALLNTRRLHGFRNAGATPLRYLVMTAPGPPVVAVDRAAGSGERSSGSSGQRRDGGIAC
jgi:mannose-6-phosphate isomerase-like protein (cupin superfamily)